MKVLMDKFFALKITYLQKEVLLVQFIKLYKGGYTWDSSKQKNG